MSEVIPDTNETYDDLLEMGVRHIQKIIVTLHKNLQRFEEAQAVQGIQTPPGTMIQIDRLKEEIKEKEAELKKLTTELAPRPVDPKRFELSLRLKEPSILEPKFDRIYDRMKFLFEIDENTKGETLESQTQDLIEYIKTFQKGGYYANKIARLLRKQKPPVVIHYAPRRRTGLTDNGESLEQYRARLRAVSDEVCSLLIQTLKDKL